MCLCSSCDRNSTENQDSYIGGRIVNPTSNQVILLKDNVPLDTLILDHQKKFGYRIEDAEAGIYCLKNGPEKQIFYLKPGDSILIRANSTDFDESLHFSGRGGEENNFLSEILLSNSDNTGLVLSYYKISPAEFARRTDSVKNSRLELLSKRNEKYNFSDDFAEVARKTIDYENYDLRERYTYMVNKYFKEHAKQLTEDFHAYRGDVNFNEISLQTSPSYIRFIDSYLINRAMTACARANRDRDNCYNLYDHHNITTRIHIIDSITDLPLIKEHFFSKFSVLGTIMAGDTEEIDNILNLMKDKGYTEEELKKLNDVGRVQLAYLPGRNIGKVPLLDTNGSQLSYNEVTNKPAVIFLWSIYSQENHRQSHRTIQELRRKYPGIAFIGVNVDPGETSQWINTVKNFGYDENGEYQLARSSIDQETFRYYLNKVLLVTGSGEVYKGDAYINSPEFESRILELLNQ